LLILSEIPKHFCPQPFDYLHTTVGGRWKPCCRTGWSKEAKSFEDWWFEDKDLAQLRSEMLTEPGEMCKKVCNITCYDLERKGVKSYRNDAYDDFLSSGSQAMELIDNFRNTGMSISRKRFITLKPKGLGNFCNLKCFMCPPHLSSSRSTEMIKMSDDTAKIFYERGIADLDSRMKEYNKQIKEYQDLYFEIIELMGDQLCQINLSGGEPTMISGFIPLLDKLVETGHSKEMKLFLNSNMTRMSLLENNFSDYFKYFKNVTIHASIDNIGKYDEWQRYPTKFNEIEECIDFIRTKYPKVILYGNTTWSVLNVEFVEEINEFLTTNKLDLAIPLNFVFSPITFSAGNHPNKKNLIEKYSKSNIFWINNIINELKNTPFNEMHLYSLGAYAKELDGIRGTNALDLWPWLEKYYD
tara:strand:- start:4075 stop:5310 length:1236 start_codon:yes stop_codon:yes gene_type:complete